MVLDASQIVQKMCCTEFRRYSLAMHASSKSTVNENVIPLHQTRFMFDKIGMCFGVFEPHPPSNADYYSEVEQDARCQVAFDLVVSVSSRQA
jgi:hypothetical protein